MDRIAHDRMQFDMALSYERERELGLEHWGASAPQIEGIHLHFCAGRDPHNQLLTLAGRVSRPAMAVDLRLQSATWMREFDASFVTGASWLVDGGYTAR
jgi:hypothetical protein